MERDVYVCVCVCVCMYKFLLCKVTLPLAALSVFLSHLPFEVFHAIIGIFGALWLQNVMLLCALRCIFLLHSTYEYDNVQPQQIEDTDDDVQDVEMRTSQQRH